MSRSDPELWQDIVDGKNAAWGELVNRYQPLVYAVATRAGLSMTDAADCFQQTWVLLYQNRRKLQDPSRLSAWLVTTAKREAIRLRRRAGSDMGDGSDVDHVDSQPLPDDQLVQLELQGKLEVAIKELNPRCQKLVDAFFFAPEESSYEEIARSLGIALNSLGPTRRRCLEQLRQILGRHGYLESTD